MNAFLDEYRIRLRTIMLLQLQYRVALVVWLIGLVLEPLIYLVVLWLLLPRHAARYRQRAETMDQIGSAPET